MTDRHVVVLAGGLTHERDVSLRSGARLTDALKHQGLEVVMRDADAELLPWLTEHRPDAAVIAMHGGRGEDGSLQGVLEMCGVPFVGTESRNCQLAWDKTTAKNLVRRAGFTTPKWISLSHSTFRDLGASTLIDAVIRHLGLPLMLKPLQGGSALGASVVREAPELPAALVGAFAYGDVVLIEEFIAGIEVALPVVEVGEQGPQALPLVEISFTGDYFDYESRYTAGLTTYHTPARLPEDVTAGAQALAVGIHQTLGLRDVSRSDAIVAPDGTVYFLEANVSPGLTETSMFPMAVAARGDDLGALYVQLIEQAIERG